MGQHPKKHPYGEWSPGARAQDVLGDKWTLMIIRVLIGGPVRFVDIQRRLPGISTEQLRTRLSSMTSDGLLVRERFREVPPRVQYSLTERGRGAIPILEAFARWGVRWEGDPRRPGEVISIESVLLDMIGVRSLPGFQVMPVILEVVEEASSRFFLVRAKNGEVEFTKAGEISDLFQIGATGTTEQWTRFIETGDVNQLGVLSDNAKTLLLTCFGGWAAERQSAA